MPEIFGNIIGDFNGYALEDSDFDSQSDDSDVDAFFDQKGENSIVNKKAIRKSKKIFKKTTQSSAFGGF